MTISTHDILRAKFGFNAFRPGQSEVIDHLLAGRSSAAVFPTGGGKSLCYQLPALVLPGLTLVVSPLIALMKDQIDRLKKRGIAADRLDSTLTADESRALMAALRAGELKMLYVAPERFVNERFREAIQRIRVSLFAVDEAHCISEWGHNFRPDYLKLAQFAKLCHAERVLALTATATPQVLDDICRGFSIATECAVRTGFYRPNLTVLTTPMAAAERDAALVERLKSRPSGPTIVYVTLQRTAEEVATRLAATGFHARPYHAGMEDDVRAAVQDWFSDADNAVVVATIAFGMGIDKANIRYVYHYNLPKSLENFSQEIGRSGRDGEPSTCETFVCPDDLNALENFVYGDTPSLEAIRGLVDEIYSLGDDFDVSLYELAAHHDIRTIVVRTLLTYLELDGYVQEGTPFYSSYQFRPLATSAEILSKFEGERRDFLTRLFRCAAKAKIWFTIDLDDAVAKTGGPRERVVRALDYLGEQSLLELKAEGVRHRFRRMRRPPPNLADLAASMHARMVERESREIARLNQVLELAAHDGCQVSRLGEHFGEPLAEPCGHCSWCLNGRATPRLLPRPAASIDESLWRQALALRAQQPEPLADPRSFVRFLCGLTSPKLSRDKITSLTLFGSLGHVPFAEVLKRAENP
jgi:ATP-dependent DNA helicase RecQ